MQEVKIDIRYSGGSADDHKIDLYDAGASITGIARAIAITTHALVSGGEVRTNAGSVPNVKTYLHPSKKGSLIESISIIFEDPAVAALGVSTISASLWAMIKYTW